MGRTCSSGRLRTCFGTALCIPATHLIEMKPQASRTKLVSLCKFSLPRYERANKRLRFGSSAFGFAPCMFAFIYLGLRNREHLRAHLAELGARSSTIGAWRFGNEFFFCHGVSLVPTDQHVVSAAVSWLKVNRLPNAAAAVTAKRAASLILRVLKRNACSSR